MYCRKCGVKLPDDALYCINCGAKVAETTNVDNKNVNNNNMNEGDSKSNNAIYIIALIVIAIIMLTSSYNVIFNTIGLCILKFGWDYGKKAFKSHEWMKLVGIIVCCLLGFCIIAVGKQMLKKSSSRRIKRYSSIVLVNQHHKEYIGDIQKFSYL